MKIDLKDQNLCIPLHFGGDFAGLIPAPGPYV